MKKIFLTIAFIATGLVASAQVGIGNTDPKTTLHVTGTNAAGTGELAAADGVTVPRVVTDMRDTGTAAAGLEIGQLVYSTNAASTGFWYWAGATEKWNPLVAAASAGFSSIALQKDSNYTTLDVAELTGNVNTITFAGSSPTGFTITSLGAGDVGKIVNFYNASATNVGASFDPAGTATTASLTMLGSRGYSLVWTANGWARTSY